MTKRQKLFLSIVTVFSLVFGMVPTANAMHIMEGYLPGTYCLVWGAICVPFLIWGFFSIRNTLTDNRKIITVLSFHIDRVFQNYCILLFTCIDTLGHVFM